MSGSRARVVALQRAVDMDSFWRASLGLLRAELGQRSVALYSDIVDFEPRQLRYHVSSPGLRGYVPARSLSVSAPFLARHRGRACCSYEEILAEDPQASQRRLQQESNPGWRDFVQLAFWRKSRPHGALAILAGDRIQAGERTFLEELHPMLDAGLRRLQALEQERKLSGLLQGYLQNSPEALVFFDRRGAMLYQSAHGEQLFRDWNRSLGRGQEQLGLPAALRGAFQSGTTGLDLRHPARPELQATLTTTPGGYVLRLADTGETARPGEASPGLMKVLGVLTPSEQRVVRLVVGGLSNRQVAERLCRSPRTIETQLLSAFHKLKVNSRMQLLRLVS